MLKVASQHHNCTEWISGSSVEVTRSKGNAIDAMQSMQSTDRPNACGNIRREENEPARTVLLLLAE